MKNEVRVIRNYSFWSNPIKYFRDRRKIRFLDHYLNDLYRNGLKEEIQKAEKDFFLYGTAIMKDGKRIDPRYMARK